MRVTALQAMVTVLLGASLCAGEKAHGGETIGSPIIPRQYTDIDSGQVDIYDGGSSPFSDSGKVANWSFFDELNRGRSVTPVIFRLGSNSFTVSGIGTTRISTGRGLQTYPFGLLAGSDQISGGRFTFGFTDRAYRSVGSTLVAGTSNDGVIPFDRPGPTVPIDPWQVTAEGTSPGPVNLQIGSVIGAGGVPIFNPFDPGGLYRVYSAQMTITQYLADFNVDGKVDFGDLLILAQHYGTRNGATRAIGDANSDGSVNFDDLLVVAQEYGDGTAAPFAASPVPEPTAGVAGIAVLSLSLRRRR